MPFNPFGKRKKYPHNKKKAAPSVGVYAGPEYFRRRAGEEPEEVLDVYAGPEFFEEQLTPPEEIGKVFEEEDAPLPPEDDARFHTVYAGPEPPPQPAPVYAGPAPRKARAGRIYAGPEPPVKPKEPPLLVYAGPEYFKRRRAEEDISALASGVYAGPEPGQGGMPGSNAPPVPKEDGKADGEA